ncbi:MAG TPA: FxsB family cyclophane-forming radical SAM/SPASM peptide maturase [Streptosporangiaceae bacterium]|nr:FxsB family cyclophane-forming radical SAM/SPASM peptide maturase [Streptosporangiaceae bacterium]
MPGSITQYVLKVHSRCDLACDHCYVYEHADKSWRVKPKAISKDAVRAAAARIAEHAATHQLTEVRIILHGGEPLLLGRDGMRMVLSALDSGITPVARTDIRIHTNGVLLDRFWCALFDEYGVRIGVSLDGDRAANDRHRRFADGRSSHQQVKRALALLRQPEHRHLYAGILCTVDLGNDPVAVYEALIAEDPPILDLLLPHATWDNPPARPAGPAEPYAAWLTSIYQRWVRDGRPVPIRLFDSLLSAARGGPSWSEAVGLEPVDLLVIETDGTWEQPDSLKTAYDGAPATGLDVFSHSVDEVARLPGFVARQGGLATLSEVCQACAVVRICGGGLYAHRYRSGSGFDNPSVYCADIKALIGQLTAGRREPRPPAVPRPRHVLPEASFDALAAGPGDIGAIMLLADMRLSLTRALVATVASADDGWRNLELRQAAAEGWALLCALDAEHPEAVREIFRHPYTHLWAARCLRPDADADYDLDRAHLAGLAAAAALRAGATAKLGVPVRDGAIYLPTAGALRIEAGPARTAVVCVSPGGVTAEGHRGRWQPARRVAGGVLRVAVEDLDPFRDCQQWPAAGRLSAAQWRAWREGLGAAGAQLMAAVPAYASVLRTGLRSVVPMRRCAAPGHSSAAKRAFGAVAIALPEDPDGIDALLLGEFQRVKLDALAYLHDLFDPEDRRRLRVPWRSQPLHVEGILYDAYGYLALAHLWQSRRIAAPGLCERYRSWVCDATAALSAMGSLTSDGERFAAGMNAAAQAVP